MHVRRHNFTTQNGDEITQRYDRLQYVMPLQNGPVLAANCYIIEATQMWATAEKIMREDPLFFVDC
jgi:hypothetical protein